MITLHSPMVKNLIQWYAASGGVKKGQLVKSASGAAPVAAAHSGQTLLGLAMNDADANEVVYIYPLGGGTILAIDYDPTATKVTCAATDLGSQFDVIVDATSGDMICDLDDTSGGYLVLVGYDNTAMKAFVCVDEADILIS